MDSETSNDSYRLADKIENVSAMLTELDLASNQVSNQIASLKGAYDEIAASVVVGGPASTGETRAALNEKVPRLRRRVTFEDEPTSSQNSLSAKFLRQATPDPDTSYTKPLSKVQQPTDIVKLTAPNGFFPGSVASPRVKNQLSLASVSDGCDSTDIPKPPSEPPEALYPSERKSPLHRMTVAGAGHTLRIRSIWCEGDTDMIEGLSQQLKVSVTRNDTRMSVESMDPDFEVVDEDNEKLRCPVAHPGGASRLVWNGLCLGLITYDILTIPMAAFGTLDSIGFFLIEWLCTLFWTADMIFNFRTGYFVGSQLEMRPNYIFHNYATTWLLLDAIIVIMEWVGRFTSVAAPASLIRTSRILRTMRFLKLMRLAKLQTLWVHVAEQINSNTFHMVFNMTVLTLSLMICVHLIACAWYALGESKIDGWTKYDAYEGEKGVPFWYLASQRWVIAQLNGRTDMNDKRNMIERGFTCLVGVTMSVIAKAIFTSVITKTLLELSQLTSENTRRRRLVNAYLETHSLGPTLTASVKRYLQEYQDPDKEHKKEKQVLAILPQHVQSDLLLEVRSPRLIKHSLFATMSVESPRCVRRICTTVVQLVSPVAYEIVFDKGDTCSRMLFIDRGTLTYGEPSETSPVDSLQLEWDNQMLLRSGRWLSEPALWSEWLNYGRLASDYYTCLYALQAKEFAKALKEDRGEYARTVLYARRFIEELTSQRELSDIVHFEVIAATGLRKSELAPRYVRVTIVSASGLRNSDRGMFGTGKSDPYCVCEIAGRSGQDSKKVRCTTVVVENCLDPYWDHSATLPYFDGSPIEFEVLDKDFGPVDDSLGRATLEPHQFEAKGFHGELPLAGVGATGQLKVKVRMINH